MVQGHKLKGSAYVTVITQVTFNDKYLSIDVGEVHMPTRHAKVTPPRDWAWNLCYGMLFLLFSAEVTTNPPPPSGGGGGGGSQSPPTDAGKQSKL